MLRALSKRSRSRSAQDEIHWQVNSEAQLSPPLSLFDCVCRFCPWGTEFVCAAFEEDLAGRKWSSWEWGVSS